MTAAYDYEDSFSRNIGWVTRDEQQILRGKRVAIAGLGGVGGSHLLTLARLGIGAFNLADYDAFEPANFNRQAGAFTSTIGKRKLDVVSGMARDINPEIDVRAFPQGVNAGNVEQFLDGADVYVDGLDFFVLDVRIALFEACERLGIPAVTAAPLGMGAALLCFLPGRMTFDEYFRLKNAPPEERPIRFLLGLSPAMPHRGYLVDPTAVDLAAQRGPSTGIACELCAGVASAQVLKLLLRRGRVPCAPVGMHFDAYRMRLKKTWRPWGNHNPIQRVALAVARRQIRAMGTAAGEGTPEPEHGAADQIPATIRQILELARWAPSGDNQQPWLFEVIDDRRFVVHGHDTREDCVYDLQGHASELAFGMLLETIDLAGTELGFDVTIARRPEAPVEAPLFDVTLRAREAPCARRWSSFIRARSVNRRGLSRRRLTGREKAELEASVGKDHRLVWIEGGRRKRALARLLFRNAGVRMRTPEAHHVHASVIEWNATTSRDRMPDRALGIDAGTRKAMRWAMKSWRRSRFLGRYLGATVVPRLEMDFLPALRCAGHFLLVAKRVPAGIDDYVAAGRAMQRFWLTATRLGLWVQPEYTPLVFSEYVRDGIAFTRAAGPARTARAIDRRLARLLGADHRDLAVFMGRIGEGRPPLGRSIRKPLEELLIGVGADRRVDAGVAPNASAGLARGNDALAAARMNPVEARAGAAARA